MQCPEWNALPTRMECIVVLKQEFLADVLFEVSKEQSTHIAMRGSEASANSESIHKTIATLKLCPLQHQPSLKLCAH